MTTIAILYVGVMVSICGWGISDKLAEIARAIEKGNK